LSSSICASSWRFERECQCLKIAEIALRRDAAALPFGEAARNQGGACLELTCFFQHVFFLRNLLLLLHPNLATGVVAELALWHAVLPMPFRELYPCDVTLHNDEVSVPQNKGGRQSAEKGGMHLLDIVEPLCMESLLVEEG